MNLILNSLFPVFGLLVLGYFLKRFGLTNDAFIRTSDRVIYYVFFPIMLFWKIGTSPSDYGLEAGLYIAGTLAILIIFALSTIGIRVFKISHYEAGAYSQGCYRFNTYVGMAVILNALGEEGIRYFGILIGIAIPIINILIISILIWHSGLNFTSRQRLSHMAKAMISNPLILGCAAGIIYSRIVGELPVFLDNTFSLASMVTLPLALLSIGGTLTLATLRDHIRVASLAAMFKLVILPLVGFALLRLFNVEGIAFKTGMIFFALPMSTASYVMSAQLNSDAQLASASIVLSTALSFVSLSIALMI